MNDQYTTIQAMDNQRFENMRKFNEDGVEYWEARELEKVLGYVDWRNFLKVIEKAKHACVLSDQSIDYHFVDVTKMIKVAVNTPKETTRKIDDLYLSRYACYLIAQNGDSNKAEIAAAQTYFAVQTRRQELSDQFGREEKRLFIRREIKTQNKNLFSTAHRAGVENFGKFNDMGYRGLYGLTKKQIQTKKKIGKDDVLDRAGATELAANLFRITQTEDKIRNEDIKGEGRATLAHYVVGNKVRRAIKDIRGTMPEDLMPEENIRLVAKKHSTKKLPILAKSQFKLR